MKVKMKELNKKTISTLIMTMLMLSMAVAAMPASAIGTPSLDPSLGPVGTEVTVTVANVTIGGLVRVYWDSVSTAGFLAEGYAVGLTATIDIVIPEAIAEDHYVITKDVESGASAYEIFVVNSEIELTLDVGVVGDTITVSGTGFAEESEITLDIGGTTLDTVPATVTTSSLGSFTCEFDILDTEDGPYTITATDEDTNAATADLVVGKYITLDPDRGLIGATVTVAGRGFAPDETVDIRWYIDGGYVTLVNDYDIDENGDFSTTITVPLVGNPVAAGDPYDVLAIDSDGGQAEAVFTVVEEASITLSTDEGQPEDPFDVSGEWFTADSTVTITFDGIELAADVATDGVGSFGPESVAVPEDASPGVYTVTATDAEGVSASATFTVLPPLVIEIRTRATEYLPGDTISIYGKCSAAPDSAVVITDPNGVLFFLDEDVAITEWDEVDDWDVLPYYATLIGSFPIPADAPLGSWNFTAYDVDDEILDTNLFTVVASPSIQTVLDRLDELDASITDLVTTSDGDTMALITTTSGDILSNLNDIDTKIVGLASHAGDNYVLLNTTLGELEVKLDYIKPLITKIEGDVVTINTILGTVSGKVTTIEGNVATIATDVGTIKVDISAVTTAATTTGTKADAALTAAQAAQAAAEAAKVAATAAGTKTDAALTAAQAATTAAQGAKTSADSATTAANAAKAATDGLTTLVYAAIGASLVAALAAVVALMQISKKIA